MKRILVILGLVALLCPFVRAAQNGTTFTTYISTAVGSTGTTVFNGPCRIQNFSIVSSSANATTYVYFFDGTSTIYSTNSVYGTSLTQGASSNASQQINLGDSALIIRNKLTATSSDPYGNNKVQLWIIPDEGDN